MFNWHHTLIWNWKSAYKWASIQFIALGASYQLAIVAFPDTMKADLPPWLIKYGAIFCLMAAGYGRITTRTPDPVAPQETKNV